MVKEKYTNEHHFKTQDAIDYGVTAAIILYNIEFWVAKNKANNKHFYDGHYWTYNSINAFYELFPYLSINKIRGALEILQEKGAIKTANYNKATYDRTLWYTTICLKSQMDLPKITNGFTENHKPIPDNKPDNKLTDKVTRLNNNTLIMTASAENLSSASLILDNVVGTTGFFKIWDYQTDDKFKIWVNSQKLEYLNFKTKQQILDYIDIMRDKIISYVDDDPKRAKKYKDYKAVLKNWIRRDIEAAIKNNPPQKQQAQENKEKSEYEKLHEYRLQEREREKLSKEALNMENEKDSDLVDFI